MKLPSICSFLFIGAISACLGQSSPLGVIRTRADEAVAFWELYRPPMGANSFLSVQTSFRIPQVTVPIGQPANRVYSISLDIALAVASNGALFGFSLEMIINEGYVSYHASVSTSGLVAGDYTDLQNFPMYPGNELEVMIEIRPQGTSFIRIENLDTRLGHVERFAQAPAFADGARGVKWSLGSDDDETPEPLAFISRLDLEDVHVTTDRGPMGGMLLNPQAYDNEQGLQTESFNIPPPVVLEESLIRFEGFENIMSGGNSTSIRK